MRGISQMHFLTINRNIGAVQIPPFPVKEHWPMMSITFVFLTYVFNSSDDDMKSTPPQVDSTQKNSSTDQEFFPPKARARILGMTWGQSSSKSCCSEHFSSAHISFSE